MSIVYERRSKEIVYYVYKCKTGGYGVSVVHRSGDTAMLPSCFPNVKDAENFVRYLRRNEINPVGLQSAARAFQTEYRRKAV
ncbi:MAG: hypothetical protein E7501_03015 [Ruminococcus sp.]|nr:hypothetical protein [Ruminococcus sp.]MBQ8905743.1 hypothetical protein [Ruminococcus sp.]